MFIETYKYYTKLFKQNKMFLINLEFLKLVNAKINIK